MLNRHIFLRRNASLAATKFASARADAGQLADIDFNDRAQSRDSLESVYRLEVVTTKVTVDPSHLDS